MAHGMVMPVMASEYQSLTDEEKVIFKTTAKIVDNKLPTVAGVTGISDTQLSWLSMPKVLVLTQ